MALVPHALSRLGSDDAEDPEVLQTRADTDRMRAGSGRTSARPGGDVHPARATPVLAQSFEKLQGSKNSELLDQPGPCEAGPPVSTPPSAFLALSLGHIWPTCGSHYHSQGLCKAIFIHRMVGGGGSLLRTLALCWMRGGGAQTLLDSGTQLCARGVEPAFPGPSSSQLASALRNSCVHSLGMILGPEANSRLRSGTKSKRISIKV